MKLEEGFQRKKTKLTFFMSVVDDHMLFYEVVKSEKWRRAMDAEI